MIVLSVVSLLLACGDKSDDTYSPEDTASVSVDGCTFEDLDLVFQSAEGFEPVDDVLSIGFTKEPCEMSFSAGCNTHAGEYAVVNGVLEIPEMYSSYMECETELMDQDSWIATFFTSGPTVVHDEDTITFTGTDSTLVFVTE